MRRVQHIKIKREVSLAQFFKIKRSTLPRGNLPPINVLPQQRSKLTHIEDLAVNICSNGGLIYPVNLIRFETKTEADAYVKFFRRMYGKGKKIVYLPDSDGSYTFLVAGHRRWAAVNTIPINEVRKLEVAYIIPPKDADIETVSLKAAFFQASENIQTPPDPIDKAYSIVAMRNAMMASRRGKKVTIAEIVKETGQAEGSVADAIRFYGLPDFLRSRGIKKHLPYGKALIIGRLFYALHKEKHLVGMPEIRFVLESTIAQRTPEDTLTKRVMEIIRLRKDEILGQDLFSGGANLASVVSVETRGASHHHEVLFRTSNATLKHFAATVRSRPVLLDSELATIHTKSPLRELVMENVSALEELAKLLHAVGELSHAQEARMQNVVDLVRRMVA